MDEVVLSSPLAAEILEKHRRSQQPASQHLCAAVVAIVTHLNSQNMDACPAAVFAMLLSTLKELTERSSIEELAALCQLLYLVVGRVSPALLRRRWMEGSTLLADVVEKHKAEAGVVKPAVGCLGPFLAAMDPQQWPGAARPFSLLLSLALDNRPKVRKVAKSSIIEALAVLQTTEVHASATNAVFRVCQEVLAGPAVAAQAAAGASQKNRKAADELLARAVADALHLTGMLKEVLPLLGGPDVTSICNLLLNLLSLRQPLLTRQAAEALGSLCTAPKLLIPPATLAQCIQAVLPATGTQEMVSSEGLPSLLQFLELACSRLQQEDPGLVSSKVSSVVHAMVPLLAAEQEGVRLAAVRSLGGIIRATVDSKAAASAVGLARAQLGGAPSAVESVASAIQSALGTRYSDSWPQALSVASTFFEAVGQPGAPLAGALLARVGELAAAVEDAQEDEGAATALDLRSAINATMGVALSQLGAEAVLAVLPLNLNNQGFSGQVEMRTWLLPLIRRHVRGSKLAYWGKTLMPTARDLFNLAKQMAMKQQSKLAQAEALKLQALELQIWQTLPAFACWPRDGVSGIMPYIAAIFMAYKNRSDLRPSICRAVRRLCEQPRLVLKAQGRIQSTETFAEREDDSQKDEDDLYGADVEEVPEYYTSDMAERDLQHVKKMSIDVLQVLVTEFESADASSQSFMTPAISAYAAAADAEALHSVFKSCLAKYIKVYNTESDEPMDGASGKKRDEAKSEKLCTLLDLALALAPGIPAARMSILYKAACTTLQLRDQALQKHGYKVLAYLCQYRPDFLQANFAAVVSSLLAGVASSLSAAKRFRLACLQAVILALQSPEASSLELPSEVSETAEGNAANQVVMQFLTEVILCVKEVNKKTRAAAFDLLVKLARAMEEANPASVAAVLDTNMGDENSAENQGGLATLFVMVLAGLVGQTPHMQSATVMALARLVYEFASELEGFMPRLLPAVVSLLRTKSREVVKSVLGFLKVCAMRLPVEILEANLGEILAALLIWSDDTKNKFKLKVRLIVERLVKRCGYDAVAAKMPEGDMRLLTHIRKAASRRNRLKRGREEGDEGQSVKSGVTQGHKTARRSDWAATAIFSDEKDAGKSDMHSRRSGHTRAARSVRNGTLQTVRGADGEVLDLLDAGTSRRMVQAKAERRAHAGDDSDFEMDEGRLVIREDDDRPQKRKRGEVDDGYNSEDSDFADLRGIKGVRAAWKSTEHRSAAQSSMGKSSKGKSYGGKSDAGKSARSQASKGGQGPSKSTHTGERFKGKTGGDMKGKSKVEPYAYWPLDRRMLNKKRKGKQAQASKGLANIVKGAKAGAAKGRKAKRQRTM